MVQPTPATIEDLEHPLSVPIITATQVRTFILALRRTEEPDPRE